MNNIFLVLWLIVMSVLFYKIATAENEYKAIGELYQCFVEGEQIYASNDRPRHLGGDWYMINDSKFKADGCFCMDCIGF